MSGMDRISMLPDLVLEKIFLLLPLEDAAHMTVVSSIWRGFWAMLPIFNFTFEQKFPAGKLDLVNHVDHTLSKIPPKKAIIQRFRLCMYFNSIDCASHVDNWIRLVTKTCIREMDIEMSNNFFPVKYCLPSSTFAAKSLEFLTLKGCNLEKPVFVAGRNFCRLRKLFLINVYLDDETLHYIIHGCRALECFALLGCVGMTLVEIPCLPKLTNLQVHDICDIISTGRVHLFGDFGQSGCLGTRLSISIAYLECLRDLDIGNVQITDDLFQELISKLPLLRRLALTHCFGMTRIKVSHCFLEKLDLTLEKGLMVLEVQTPMLLSFKYGCDVLPDQLTINAPSLQKSCLKMTTKHNGCLDTRWFLALRDYLSKFDQHDKITLRLPYKSAKFDLDELNDIEIPPLPVVKKLKLMEGLLPQPSNQALLDGLLWTCHPDILAINHFLKKNASFIRLLSEKLIDRVEDPLCCMNIRIRCWRHFLRHVITENLSIVEDEDDLLSLPWTYVLIQLQWI